MSAELMLADLAREAGAERVALFRSRGGILGDDPPLSYGPAPAGADELLQALAHASALSGGSVQQLAQELAQALQVPRRRERYRGNVLRLPLGRLAAEVVLFRGDGAAGPGLERALAALESEVLAWEPAPHLRPACAFVSLDDRTTLLLAADGRVLSMSASMRRALGAELPAGSFVVPPARLSFLAQIRELARGAEEGRREEARGLGAPGVVSVERHEHDLLLVRVLGPADLQARVVALSASELTPREIACGVELTAGKSYRAIASALQLSPDTVKLHLRAVYQKLGVHGREHFVALMAGISVPPRRVRPGGAPGGQLP